MEENKEIKNLMDEMDIDVIEEDSFRQILQYLLR